MVWSFLHRSRETCKSMINIIPKKKKNTQEKATCPCVWECKRELLLTVFKLRHKSHKMGLSFILMIWGCHIYSAYKIQRWFTKNKPLLFGEDRSDSFLWNFKKNNRGTQRYRRERNVKHTEDSPIKLWTHKAQPIDSNNPLFSDYLDYFLKYPYIQNQPNSFDPHYLALMQKYWESMIQ